MADGGWLSTIGELAKQVLLNTPMGVNFGGGRAPQWTIGSAIQPWLDRQRHEEGLTQLKTMGLLPDDVDTSQLAKMDPQLMSMAFNLMGKQGREAKLGDVPGATEAFFGVKAPQSTPQYGVMAPEQGEGPTLTQQPPEPEAIANYEKLSSFTFPRLDIHKKLAEHQGMKSAAANLRQLFPEFADQIPDEISTSEMVTARATFAAERKQKKAEAKEQEFSDAAAKQYGLPPGMPPTLAKEEILRQRQERAFDRSNAASEDRFNRSQAASEARFNKSQASSESKFGRQMSEWDRRHTEMQKAAINKEGRDALRKSEEEFVQGLNVSIRHTETLIQKYRESMMAMMPKDKIAAADELSAMELDLRKMRQRKRQVQDERLKSSPLAATTGKGGEEEALKLFD